MKKEKEWRYGRPGVGSRVFDICNGIFMVFICIIMLYPLWYVLCRSFSDPLELGKHTGVLLWPIKFSTQGYDLVFSIRPSGTATK